MLENKPLFLLMGCNAQFREGDFSGDQGLLCLSEVNKQTESGKLLISINKHYLMAKNNIDIILGSKVLISL
jgi:hypothetical protein